MYMIKNKTNFIFMYKIYFEEATSSTDTFEVGTGCQLCGRMFRYT